MSLFTSLDTLEYPINASLQNLDGNMLDGFFLSVSNISLMIGFFMIMLLFLFFRQKNIWKSLILTLIIGGIISYLINEGLFKIILADAGLFRPRPWTIHPDLLAIGHGFRDSSFPSSHMAFTTLLVMIIYHFEKRFLPWGIIIILLMGISRIHNGMHYVSDVLVGSLLGVLYAFIGISLVKRFGMKIKTSIPSNQQK